MRYFLAFIVNDLTAEWRVIELQDRAEKSAEQLIQSARDAVQWDDASVELREVCEPSMATWRLPAHQPAIMTQRIDGVFADPDEMRFRRLLEG